jgi:GTPase SAR1 family protein
MPDEPADRPPASPPEAAETAARVQISRIAALLQQGERQADASELLRQAAAPERAKPALFVAGEDKRGKSCLVNALLRRADLSPVGVEVTTAAPITFFASPRPWARVFHYGAAEPADVPFDEARALATVAGNPRNEKNVRAVQLGVESALLDRLTLIDTPGVGGLEAGHAALTIQSIRSADALIFVADSGAQLRGPELSFLRRISTRVDTVILVLTKVDLHRGWRQILDDNVAILAEQAPRLSGCPVVPVSSLMAMRGLSAEDPEDAAALREESGLGRLEQVIDEHVVARASTLREVNLLRMGHGALGGVMLGMRQTLSATEAGGSGRQALEAERARLQQLQKDRAAWPQVLDSDVRKLSLERSEQASRGTVEIKRRYDQRLRDVKKAEFDSMPGELIADLSALAAQLNEAAAERLLELVDRMLADFDEATKLNDSIRELTKDALGDELAGTSLGDYSMSMSDRFSVVSSFSSGRSLGSLAGMVAGSIVAPPIGLAVGLGLGAVFAFQSFLTRDQHAFVAAFQSWMQAQISSAQLTINNSFQRQMIDLQMELRSSIQNALIAREQEITSSLKQAEALQASEAAKRSGAQAALKQRMDEIRQVRTETEALLRTLSAAAGAEATVSAAVG